MYVNKTIGVLRLFSMNWKDIVLIALVVVVTVTAHIELFDKYLETSIAVAAIGTAVSFFIGFFTAQAYDRWWEARKIWGEFVNDSRSFARLVLTVFPSEEEHPGGREIQHRLVRRHIAYLYAVKSHLRGLGQGETKERLSQADRERVEGVTHLPAALLEIQGDEVNACERAGFIEPIRMAQLNDMLSRFTSSMGAAERIKLTVFPPYYASMIGISIWVYTIAFALGLSEKMDYLSIPYVFLTGAIFRLVYDAGQMLLDPFENRPSDVPMSSIVRSIEIVLLEKIGAKDVPPPIEPIDGEYVM